MNSIKHHPDLNLLAEYSAGGLDWAVGLALAAHLHYCPHCRAKVAELNAVGGHLLENCPQQALASDAKQKLLARIQAGASAPLAPQAAKPAPPTKTIADPLLENLPPMVSKAVGQVHKLQWRRVSSSLKTCRIAAGQHKYEVAFHKIQQGGRVVEHGHRGMEFTLVLKGSFSDEDGVYQRGDFLVREPGEVHRPTATQNEDCLCLSVLAAPVAVTGTLGKLINPFLRFKPA